MTGKKRSMTDSPFLVTFAAATMYQTCPCDTEEEVDAVVRQARAYGGERGIVVWDRREARESRLIERTP